MNITNWEIYKSDNFVVVDVETYHGGTPDNKCLDPTAVNPKCHVILASWWYQGRYYYKWGNEYELQLLYKHMAQADYTVAHRAGFELGYFSRAHGPDFMHTVRIAGTDLASYVLAGNRPLSHSLDDIAKREKIGLGKQSYIAHLIHMGYCPSTLPKKDLLDYNLTDVKVTLDVWLAQRKKLIERNLLSVFNTRCISTPVLTDIEFRGMKVSDEINKVYLGDPEDKETYPGVINQRDEYQAKLDKITGGINFNSPKQLAAFLYDTLKFPEPRDYRGEVIKTSTGQRVANKNAFAALKPKTKLQRDFIQLITEARKIEASISKTLDPLYRCVEETDNGILYAKFNQTVTATHRLSSSGKAPYNVQFQNFPNKYKKLIVARKPGWKIIGPDYSKLEFNVAVNLGKDAIGKKEIEDGVDVHRYTASIINQIAESDVDKETRRLAKPHTFKPLFGGTSGTPDEVPSTCRGRIPWRARRPTEHRDSRDRAFPGTPGESPQQPV